MAIWDFGFGISDMSGHAFRPRARSQAKATQHPRKSRFLTFVRNDILGGFARNDTRRLLRLHAAEAAQHPRKSRFLTFVRNDILGASLPGLLLSVFCLLAALPARAAERFPPPDFTAGYTLPVTATPAPRADMFAYIDVGVLVAALLLASYLVLWKRSRRGIAALAIFSLAYFGFYRQGCVCPIGAIQNVSLSIADSSYALPVIVGAFFLLPLIFALFAGRVFCAAVCPLGAAQDVVLLRPIKVPSQLAHCLGLIPWVYLGAAVLYAATGTTFLICHYDPFVAFFRFGGSTGLLIFGAVTLLAAVFIGRIYCRFACPYGALLRLISPLAKWRVTITPDECVRCRLCEDACSFGEIRYPTPQDLSIKREEGKGRLATLQVLLPVLIALGAGLGYLGSGRLATLDPKVILARMVWVEDHKTSEQRAAEQAKGVKPLLEIEAVRRHDTPKEEVYLDALAVTRKFQIGGPIFGAWIGLVIGLKLIGLSICRKRTDYEADSAGCVACGRCYRSCHRAGKTR